MSLDLLDLLLIAEFGFKADFPWWMWVIGVLSSLGGSYRIERITKALENT